MRRAKLRQHSGRNKMAAKRAGDQRFLGQAKPQPALLLGQAKAEQAKLA